MEDKSIVVRLDPPKMTSSTYEFLIPLRNDPMIAHNLINRAKKNTQETIREWILSRTNNDKEKSLFMISKTTNNVERELIGYVTYNIIDAISGVANIGICITEKQSGKGYGKKSINLLVEILKEKYNVRKLIIEILETNTASKKLFKGLGFREVGILQKNFLSQGKYHNVCILEKLIQ